MSHDALGCWRREGITSGVNIFLVGCRPTTGGKVCQQMYSTIRYWNSDWNRSLEYRKHFLTFLSRTHPLLNSQKLPPTFIIFNSLKSSLFPCFCSRLQPLLYKKYWAHLARTYSPFSPQPFNAITMAPTPRIFPHYFSSYPHIQSTATACPSALSFSLATPDALHGLEASWSCLTFSVVFLCPDPFFAV